MDFEKKALQFMLDAEARRDNKGRLQVYNPPSNDGGGKYEVAGITSRHHPGMASALKTLIKYGMHDEAEELAMVYYRNYTSRATRFVRSEALRYLFRDIYLNRGPGGLNGTLRFTLGQNPTTKKAAYKSLTSSEARQIWRMENENALGLIDTVTKAREKYEREIVGYRANFWKGLNNRWAKSRDNAISLLDLAPVKYIKEPEVEPLSWIVTGFDWFGEREIRGSRDNPVIVAMWKLGKAGDFNDDETPWCAAYVSAALEEAGIRSARTGWARSYLSWGQKLNGPCLGAIVVFSRGPKYGHVGFVLGKNKKGHLLVLGGNQGNTVSIRPFERSRILGYRWPHNVDVPFDLGWGNLPTFDITGSVSSNER